MDAATQPYPSQIDCGWLVSDEVGHLAMLITAGEGPIPALALEGSRLPLDDLGGLVDALEICSEVEFVVDVPNPASFIDLARRGVFMFDWTDVHRTEAGQRGIYELVAKPRTPRGVVDLPPVLTQAISGLEVSGRFSDLGAIDPSRYWRDLRA
ncbi:hypothetical protein ASD38_09505 [Caulobacter sp. Root487D2Y]|uniref:hypothetical protein n=1 Tax=Caulobacter sp. Root487D2Y TaxID=1736547 RepID=UPI0006FD43A1|nr:hypothetical protein [Caulobacter sp. Root487D2Y]KQY29563.1 hypothetical protein ASD38_09505 [Caulobacter sp. Root487D2Y]